MTAAAFADLIQARSAGGERWMAKCPAHDDKLPSLSIRNGRDGRVLLYCWAGCELTAILGSLGLTMRHLFSDKPLDPLVVAQARKDDLERAASDRQRAETERKLAAYMRRLGVAVDVLGARLAHSPQDDATAALFHVAIDWLRVAEGGFAP